MEPFLSTPRLPTDMKSLKITMVVRKTGGNSEQERNCYIG